MKIVNILGGLGNQMFEYAMYLALRHAHPGERILCCTRSYGGYGLHNGYELHRIFGIGAEEATLADLCRVAYPFWNYRTWQVMNHLLPRRRSMTQGTTATPYDEREVTRTDSAFYDGYWQNEDYFKAIRSEVLDAFRFPDFTDERNRRLAETLKGRNAASCHVRRGDYLKHPVMCVCTPEYYTRAIQRMNAEANPDLYCVFSDDIAWCRENLQPLFGDREVVYVDWNKGEDSYRDMQLMSLCRHNIIANSSFSWWGAWLNRNEDKVVMAPEEWMNKRVVNEPICRDWTRIQRGMMRDIGIVTHYDVFNHGAILQLNALCKVLGRMGCNARALQFDKNYDFLGVELKSKYNISVKSVAYYLGYLWRKGLGKTLFNVRKMRLLNGFKRTERLIGGFYADRGGQIEAAVIGSDEVFALHTGPTPVFFGHCLPTDHVISYAASFGPTTMEDIERRHCVALVKSGLAGMDAISVRDRNSARVVERLTGRMPQTVCDPVILYGYKDEIARFEPLDMDRYLLVYAYDNRMNGAEEVRAVREYARRKGLKTVSPGFYHSWCDRNVNVDPVELLRYFAQAECVVTDTFHGTVMSLVTGRDMAVMLRDNGNKLVNLLEEYGLADRIVGDFSELDTVFSRKIDYGRVNAELERRRAEGMAFLTENLRRREP